MRLAVRPACRLPLHFQWVMALLGLLLMLSAARIELSQPQYLLLVDRSPPRC